MNHKQTLRDSNMEAMRLFSMLLVLMVHGCFLSNGVPNDELIHNWPFRTFWYTFIEGLSVPCVNCFILISGFFGIKVKLRSILKLLFIVFFWYFIIWGVNHLIGAFPLTKFSPLDVIKSIQGNWFIWAYFGLMLLSPFLNLFVIHTTKKQLFYFLLVFFSIEFLYTIYPIQILYFMGGYSAESFIGLYLLAGFYRKYYFSDEKIFNQNSGIVIYLCTTFLSSLFFFLCTLYSKSSFLNNISYSIFTEYSSYLVILAAFGVLIFFSRIKFQSRIINWLGASAFSVFIIHVNPLISPYYSLTTQWIYKSFSPLLWSLMLILFSMGVYLGCTLLDQIRILAWNGLIKIIYFTKASFKNTISMRSLS